MGLNALNRLLTQWAFKRFLLRNAYTGAQIRQLVAQTPFGDCEIYEHAIGMQILLEK
jgi:hypothetical protein